MTAIAEQLSARALGAGRWRVELVLIRDPAEPGARPVAHPRSVALRWASGGEHPRARIESLIVWPPSVRDRFSMVLAVDGPLHSGTPARLELLGAGWTADIELLAGEQPAPARDRAAAQHPAPSAPATIDHTARDFEALRAMLLGVIDERFGGGLADHPVSQTAALVEQLAYLGDALSYGQDAVATEAYLASARRRISVVRHAALLDYKLFEGSSARTWLRFEVTQPLRLPARTKVLTRVPGVAPGIAPDELSGALAAGALVFETLEPAELTPDHEPYELSHERHPGGRLPAGATGATLAGSCAGLHEAVLVTIEPAAPETSGAAHVVRLTNVFRSRATTTVEWAQADALGEDRIARGAVRLRAGNLVLADHGETHDWTLLPPPVAGRRYWPVLPARRPAFSLGVGVRDRALSAAAMLAGEGRATVAAVQLRVGERPDERRWVQRDSLLESGPLDPAFVVEVEDDATARLRFGDGTNGIKPPDGARFEVRMRSGGGAAGNVGPGSIAHVVTSEKHVRSVCNPTRAIGGADPEPLATARLNAPRAFRITDRAVTPAEYNAAASEVEGVADVTTIVVPSGSGPLARVRIHTGDWNVPAAPVVQRVREHLDRRRPVGVAVDVGSATAIAVAIELDVAVQSGWARAATAIAIDEALDARLLGPRSFGFGTSLHRSDLVRLIAGVPGVTDVTLRHFDWTGPRPRGGRREDLVPPFGHVIRVDNDPTAPSRGSVSVRLRAAA